MEARALGIESELIHVGYLIQKAVYFTRLVEVERALRSGGRHHPNLLPEWCRAPGALTFVADCHTCDGRRWKTSRFTSIQATAIRSGTSITRTCSLCSSARWSTLERHMSYEEYMRTSLWA